MNRLKEEYLVLVHLNQINVLMSLYLFSLGSAVPLYLFLIPTIWTTALETLKPPRDEDSSLGLMEVLLAEVRSQHPTRSSYLSTTVRNQTVELDTSRAPGTASPPLCTGIVLFPWPLLLASWLHRAALQSTACLQQFPFSPHHDAGAFILHSIKIYILPSASQ